jgi:hypothetical protein
MARAISVRLDDEADRALRALEATGLSQSQAIRTALLTEVRHRRRNKEIAAEVAGLEADEEDRERDARGRRVDGGASCSGVTSIV